MRRTTIILLVLLSSLLLLSVIFIIHLRFFAPTNLYSKDYFTETCFSGKVDSINVSSYKIIKFVNEKQEHPANFAGKLLVRPLKYAAQKDCFYYPKELSFMFSKKVSGDTLIIQLNYVEKNIEAILAKNKSNAIRATFYLYTDSTSKLAIRNETDNIETSLKKITLSEATIYSCHKIDVDSCKVDKLNIAGFYPSVSLQNSKIHIFNIDLENLNRWTVNNCEINEENLTGDSNHSIHLPKSECKKMTWKGKTKDASLRVSLDSDKASISF